MPNISNPKNGVNAKVGDLIFLFPKQECPETRNVKHRNLWAGRLMQPIMIEFHRDILLDSLRCRNISVAAS
jgi:hypothetical protein